jgi:ubiquinone/menaquinone biosynthesis C-methylase UbiE
VESGSQVVVPRGNTYDKYGSSNVVERRIMAGFFAALDAALPTEPLDTVLEVGVGEGEVWARVRERYPAARPLGVDLPDATLATAWHDRALPGAFADVVSLPFPDRAFDLVLAIEVLEHVPDPQLALQELHRVGRRHAVLSVPREPVWRVANLARGKYLRALGNTPGHVQHWSKRGFARLVAETFTVRSVSSPFPWTIVTAEV